MHAGIALLLVALPVLGGGLTDPGEGQGARLEAGSEPEIDEDRPPPAPSARARRAAGTAAAPAPRLWARPFQRLLALFAATSSLSVVALLAGGVVGGVSMGAAGLGAAVLISSGGGAGSWLEWIWYPVLLVGVPVGAAVGALAAYLLARAILPWVSPLPPADRSAVPLGGRLGLGLMFNLVDTLLHVATVVAAVATGSAAAASFFGLVLGIYLLTVPAGRWLNDPQATWMLWYFGLCGGVPVGAGSAAATLPLALGAVHLASPTVALMAREKLAQRRLLRAPGTRAEPLEEEP